MAESRIILSGRASNTADKARLIGSLFGEGRQAIIFVASATHMPRAAAIFSEAGYVVTPFPVDINIPLARRWHDAWLPDTRALLKTDTAIREGLGQAYYKVVYSAR